MDADETGYYLVVMFEDRDTYRRNADDPVQDRRYREMRELLAEDPEWHDGEVIWSSAIIWRGSGSSSRLPSMREPSSVRLVSRRGGLIGPTPRPGERPYSDS